MRHRYSTLLAVLLALPAAAAPPPESSSSREAARVVARPPAESSSIARSAGSALTTPAGTAALPGRPSSPAPVISLSVKDADLVEVVRSFARIAGVNLIVDPGVQGTVTAELVNVRWDHALAMILKINGLAMELDGRVVTVAPPARLYAAP